MRVFVFSFTPLYSLKLPIPDFLKDPLGLYPLQFSASCFGLKLEGFSKHGFHLSVCIFLINFSHQSSVFLTEVFSSFRTNLS